MSGRVLAAGAAGVSGTLVVCFLIVASVALLYFMTRSIKRVPQRFDPTLQDRRPRRATPEADPPRTDPDSPG